MALWCVHALSIGTTTDEIISHTFILEFFFNETDQGIVGSIVFYDAVTCADV